MEGKLKAAYVDPRDVGSAAAAILLQPSDVVKKFLAARIIEVHGPELVNFQDKAAALSKACGYPIRLNTVPPLAWRDTLVSYGLSKLFATSFLHTVLIADGAEPPARPMVDKSSDLLLTIWKPKYNLEAWANSAHVQAAFRK